MKYPTIVKSLPIILAVLVLAGAASAQVDLRFEPADPSVDMGDSMRLGIYLDEAIDVRTFEITMSYDETLLSSLGGGTGSLFDGSDVSFEEFDDSTPGQWYGRLVVLGNPVPAGPGELYYWDVQGDQAGSASLASVSIRMADADAVEYTVNPLSGTLEVIPPFETPALDPEPEFTPGTSNTLIWVDTGAAEYQVQASTDPGFSSIAQDSGWITDSSVTFGGLTSGQTYYYRLRGRVDTPAYESPWSTTESSTQDDELPTSSAQAIATYQTNATFAVPWTASDAISGLEAVELWFDDNDDDVYELAATDDDPAANVPFTFTATSEGLHRFYTVAVDGVGNREAAPGAADVATTVDTVAPATAAGPLDPAQTAATFDVPWSGGDATTGLVAVDLYYDDGTGPVFYTTDADPGAGLPFSFDAPADGEYAFYTIARDLAGNEELAPATPDAETTVDTTAPTTSAGPLDPYQTTLAFDVPWSGSDALSGLAEVDLYFDGGGGPQLYATDADPGAGQPFSFVAPTSGTYTFYTIARDAFGNEETAPAGPDASTLVDAVLPTSAAAPLTPYQTAASFAIDWTAEDLESGLAQVQLWVDDNADGTYDLADTDPAPAGTGAFSFTGADGVTYAFYTVAVDVAGNTEATPATPDATTTVDTSAPTGSFAINGGAEYTTAAAVTLDSAVDGAIEMRFSDDGATWEDWVSYGVSYSWTLPGGDGSQTVYAEYRDAAGNTLTLDDATILDATDPESAVGMLATYQGAATFDVPWTAADATSGLAEVQLWVDDDANGTYDLTQTDPAPAGSGSFSFTGADGVTYAFYTVAVDAAGNAEDAPTTPDATTTVDTTAPTGTFVIDGDAPYADTTVVSLDSGVPDAVEMRFRDEGSAWTAWLPYAGTYAWTLPAGDGPKTVEAEYRDAAGNLLALDDAITLDATDPESAVGTLTVYQDIATFDVPWTASDATSGLAEIQLWVDDNADGSYDLTDTDAAPAGSGTFSFTGADGVTYAFYTIAVDVAGNTEVAPVTPDATTTVDTSAPTGTFAINGGAEYTTTAAVTLDNAVDGATEMRFSDDGATWSGWVAYGVTYPWNLPGGDGAQTVYAEYRDAAGNALALDDAITLDATDPESAVGTVAAYQSTATFDVPWTATDATSGLFEVQLWVDDDEDGNYDLTATDGGPADSGTFSFTGADGVTYAFYTVAVDAAGNAEDAPTTPDATTTVDTTAPTGTFVIDGDAPYADTTVVSLDSGVPDAVEMRFRDEGSAWTAWLPYAGTYAWTLPAGDGPKTVEAEYRDAAGNLLALDDAITLDATDPESAVGTLTVYQDIATFDVPWTASDATSGLAEIQLWVDDNADGSYDLTDTDAAPAGSGTFSFTGADGVTYAFYTIAVDVAGNTEVAPVTPDATTTVDTSAPTGTFAINGGAEYTTTAAVTLDNAVDGATEMRFSDDGATWSGWVAYGVTYPWNLPGGDGAQTVYAEYRDAAGNALALDDAITLDATDPESAVGTVAAYQSTATFDVPWTATDATSGLFEVQLWVDDDADGTYDLADTDSAPAGSGSFSFTGADGTTYAFYTVAVDAAGNIEDAPATPDATTTVDTSAPTGTFAINAGADYTTTGAVTLDSAVDGATEMRFSDDGTTWSGWLAYGVSYPWNLPSGDGQQTVFAEYRDAAGNTLTLDDAITLDATDPESTAGPLAAYQGTETFDVPWTAADATSGLAEVQLWVDDDANGTYDLTQTDPAPAGSGSFSFTGSDGTTYAFYTVAVDAAGNAEDAPATPDVTTTVDTTVPTGSFAIDGGAPYTVTADVTLGNDVPEATEMRFRNQGEAWTAWLTYATTYAWTLAGGDGSKTVEAEFRDAAANVLPLVDTITLDGTDPESAAVALATYQGTATFEVPWTGSDATSGLATVQLWVDDNEDGTYDLAATDNDPSGDEAFSFTGADGVSYAFYTIAVDAAGNVEDPPAVPDATTTVDTSAPSGTFVIDGGAQFTTEVEVTLGSAVDGATEMRFRNDGNAWSPWVAYAPTYAWTLAGADGLKTVDAEYRDEAANVIMLQDTITLDATDPASAVGTLAGFQGTATFEVPWTGSDATSGLAAVQLWVDDDEDGTYDLAATDNDPSGDEAFPFTGTDGVTYAFYTVAVDAAGNVEDAPTTPDATTTVDTTGPSGTFVIAGDAEYTTTAEVVLNSAVGGADQMRFRNEGEAWSDWVEYADQQPWTLSGGDGEKLVEAAYRDLAGNEFDAADTIILDATAPEGGFVINNDAATTGTSEVVLDIGVTGASEMRFRNQGADWSAWVAWAASYEWTLAPGDGLRTVEGEFRDLAGNLLADADEILVDTTAPDVPVFLPEPLFTQGTSNTVVWSGTGAAEYLVETATDPGFTNVVLTTGWITATFYEFMSLSDGQIYHYRVKARDDLGNESAWSGAVFSTQDATAPVATVDDLEPFQDDPLIIVSWSGSDATSGLASVELFVDAGAGWMSFGTYDQVDPPTPIPYDAPGEGSYRFYLVARDQAGNVEGTSGVAEATVTVDLTAPSGALAINGGDEVATDIDVVLSSQVTDAVGVVEMRFTNEAGVWPGGPDAWLEFAASHPWTLTSGDGLKTVHAEYRDSAANVLALSDDITLDTTPPGVPEIVAEPEFTPGVINMVAWLAADAVAYQVQAALDPGFAAIAADSDWIDALEYTFADLSDGQTYHYRVRGRDENGNASDWSAATSSTQDASPPISVATELAPYQTSLEVTVAWTGSDAVSGLASIELLVDDGGGWQSAGVTTMVDPPEPFIFTASMAGTYGFATVATDVAGNVETTPSEADAATTIDFAAPAAASDLAAETGDQQITVSWTNPDADDLAAVEIWAALWTDESGDSAYPEYDDLAAEPTRPASRAEAEAAVEWLLLGTVDPATVSFLHEEGMDERGVWSYEIFLADLAGNYSAPADEGAQATNYLLGDINGNHAIDAFDITVLGAAYGENDGDAYYNALVDIGPTDDNLGTGIPLTDNSVEFEDLMIMSFNYLSNKTLLEPTGTATPALTWYRGDELTWHLGLLEPCATLKGLHLAAGVPDGVQVAVTAGAALADHNEHFLANIDRHGLDAGFAVLGDGAVLPVAGEILTVTTSAPVDLSQVMIEARDPRNETLEFELASEPIVTLPTAYRLADNYPNPFNPITTIAFDLPEPQRVQLAIYDLRGRRVNVLVSGDMPAGSHTVTWDGTDGRGRRSASGVYLYQIQAGPLNDTRRMLLVK